MRKITIFNTWCSSNNTGDEIIMSAYVPIIKEVFKDDLFVELPTHTGLGDAGHKTFEGSNYGIVCGTNLLSTKMKATASRNQWKIGLIDAINLGNVVLMGVGASKYTTKVSIASKFILKRILSKDKIHSVRDEYTKNKLNEIGIKNVLNTSCATMWSLTSEHCKGIPRTKGKSVVTTLTDYNRDLEKDKRMFEILQANYEKVYFWPQSFKDIDYFNRLNIEKVITIAPNLFSFDKILKEESSIDFVGTRLHGGIRAMQNLRRTIIIGIDNRALEKKSFGIKVVERSEIDSLGEIINEEFYTALNLPWEDIAKWKEQFKEKSTETAYKPMFSFYDKRRTIKIMRKILGNFKAL
ncbi:hypothetical protein PM10SUCC1_23180 [Propionigenium maris DSM 9537]|uniref:Polysaccharide pyruvyl transferase domain-containing protein n=1 Tax=Propionigenium maris DSM 9537 TaxID=1123000 RepID=A0A9W6GMZ8_9FUSO|nr:polysaccharide pyruvyl transferase family protein [Propionigenium maris]GLI56804.1 hypothetical protein PM10SUCC1_23180 [Propionigenium maris DSM 9537]